MSVIPRALILRVEEFETCYQFYRNALALPVATAGANQATFQAGGLRFDLLDGGRGTAEEVKPWGAAGNNLLPAFHVNDLERAVSRLETAGVYFASRPEQFALGRRAMFADPDGNRWQLAEIGGWECRPDNGLTGPRFVSLRCEEPSTLAAFYEQAFGWALAASDSGVVRLDPPGLTVELVAGQSGRAASEEAVVIRLEGSGEWRDSLARAGGTVVAEETWALLVADPEGHVWEIEPATGR